MIWHLYVRACLHQGFDDLHVPDHQHHDDGDVDGDDEYDGDDDDDDNDYIDDRIVPSVLSRPDNIAGGSDWG